MSRKMRLVSVHFLWSSTAHRTKQKRKSSKMNKFVSDILLYSINKWFESTNMLYKIKKTLDQAAKKNTCIFSFIRKQKKWFEFFHGIWTFTKPISYIRMHLIASKTRSNAKYLSTHISWKKQLFKRRLTKLLLIF